MKSVGLGLSLLAVISCHEAVAQALPGDTVPVQWNEITIQAIQAARPAPTVAARALAVVATAMYDAWAAFDPLAAPTQSGNGIPRQTGPAVTDAAKAQAVSYAAYMAELDLIDSMTATNPAAQASLTALATAQMTSLGYDPTDTSTDVTTPTGIGNVAAAAVLAFRHGDGSNELGTLGPSGTPYSDYSGYTTPNTPTTIADPNAWQPLAVPNAQGVLTTQKYATPFWGAVTPFAPLPAFTGIGPSRYPSWKYEADALILLAYSAGLNDTSKMIAEYWADSPGTQLPPGHWSRIAEYVSRRDQHTLDLDVQMLFAVNNALLDAGVSCWAVKRTFDSERPITAIHYLFTGKPVYAWAGPGRGTQWIDGGTWVPYQQATVITPPFAEYTSGHSTFSFAAAAVLRRFTGSDYYGDSVTFPPGSSVVEPQITPANPVTLTFPTFTAAASQAGLSRRFGGIHFVEGDLNGRADGHAVGRGDWVQAVTYFNGNTPCSTGNWGQSGGQQSSWCSTLGDDDGWNGGRGD